ncbi:MAG TPA: hypothetical protein VLT35_04410 [Methanocella sp.]|nr:hypothetical protein [Methanocella sp.]
MTYVDDDDFDEIDADRAEDELEEDDAGRCDECGLAIKKDDVLVCPACTAMYHEWCATECIRCKTALKASEADVVMTKATRRAAAAPKRRAAPRQRAR